MKKLLVALFALVAITACEKKGHDEPAGGKATGTNDPCAELRKENEQLKLISAEKDNLMREAMETSKYLNEIYSQLAGAKGAKEQSGNVKADIQQKIVNLNARLKKSEQSVKEKKEKIETLSKGNAELSKQVEDFQKMIEDLNQGIEKQKQEIAVLTEQVAQLQGANLVLTEEKKDLTEKVSGLTQQRDTKYYIIGTVDELKDWGIIRREGSILGVGGKLIVIPDFPKNRFKSVGKGDVIPNFPKDFRIISVHDKNGLVRGDQQISEGKVNVGVRAKNPDAFWSPSPYLIIANDD